MNFERDYIKKKTALPGENSLLEPTNWQLSVTLAKMRIFANQYYYPQLH